MKAVHRRLLMVAAFLMVTFVAPLARGGDLPSDLCSLLPTAVVNKTLRETFNGPEKKVAPRPFRNTNEGTDCVYKSGADVVLFRIYIDPSPESAKDLFAKLKQYFGAGSTDMSGMGDEAYVDQNKGLHVRKGKVRFFIDGVRNEQQRKALGDRVVAQL